jgi:hypothetical protein
MSDWRPRVYWENVEWLEPGQLYVCKNTIYFVEAGFQDYCAKPGALLFLMNYKINKVLGTIGISQSVDLGCLFTFLVNEKFRKTYLSAGYKVAAGGLDFDKFTDNDKKYIVELFDEYFERIG